MVQLKIDIKSTSAYKRTKISAEDNRVVSKAFGVTGALLIAILISLVVLSDISGFFMKKKRKQCSNSSSKGSIKPVSETAFI